MKKIIVVVVVAIVFLSNFIVVAATGENINSMVSYKETKVLMTEENITVDISFKFNELELKENQTFTLPIEYNGLEISATDKYLYDENGNAVFNYYISNNEIVFTITAYASTEKYNNNYHYFKIILNVNYIEDTSIIKIGNTTEKKVIEKEVIAPVFEENEEVVQIIEKKDNVVISKEKETKNTTIEEVVEEIHVVDYEKEKLNKMIELKIKITIILFQFNFR